jgi:hypothetical protein
MKLTPVVVLTMIGFVVLALPVISLTVTRNPGAVMDDNNTLVDIVGSEVST